MHIKLPNNILYFAHIFFFFFSFFPKFIHGDCMKHFDVTGKFQMLFLFEFPTGLKALFWLNVGVTTMGKPDL